MSRKYKKKKIRNLDYKGHFLYSLVPEISQIYNRCYTVPLWQWQRMQIRLERRWYTIHCAMAEMIVDKTHISCSSIELRRWRLISTSGAIHLMAPVLWSSASMCLYFEKIVHRFWGASLSSFGDWSSL